MEAVIIANKNYSLLIFSMNKYAFCQMKNILLHVYMELKSVEILSLRYV